MALPHELSCAHLLCAEHLSLQMSLFVFDIVNLHGKGNSKLVSLMCQVRVRCDATQGK
eukprot:COSAG01_NODE_24811_length_765_cov_7.369369_1_plen_58_part_00